MRKAAFFLKNELLRGVDCRELTKGNPGIGGSEYIILLTAYYLSIQSNKIEVLLFAQNKILLPECLNVFPSDNLKEAIL